MQLRVHLAWRVWGHALSLLHTNSSRRRACSAVSFLFFFSVILFLFGCAASSLQSGLLTSCGRWRLLSSCAVWAVHCGGFCCSSRVLEYRLSSCGTQTCGIFPDRGLNSRLLNWQADSLPLSHQGSPLVYRFSPKAAASQGRGHGPAWDPRWRGQRQRWGRQAGPGGQREARKVREPC